MNKKTFLLGSAIIVLSFFALALKSQAQCGPNGCNPIQNLLGGNQIFNQGNLNQQQNNLPLNGYELHVMNSVPQGVDQNLLNQAKSMGLKVVPNSRSADSLIDPSKTNLMNGWGSKESGNEEKFIEQFNKWLKEQVDKNKPKPATEKCGLPRVGQSIKVGNMWGEKGVSKKGGDGKDVYGNPATKGEEHEDNAYLREKKYGFNDPESFKVASEADYGGKDPEILKDKDGNKLKASNPELLVQSEGLKPENVYTPTKNNISKEAVPDLKKSGPGAYKPENGSDKRMIPAAGYHKGEIVNSADAQGKEPDTKVTDKCSYVTPTKQEIDNWKNGKLGWGGPQGQQDPQGWGKDPNLDGGGGPGGEGGLLNKLLPALGQALQGLGNMGGGNQNPQNKNPLDQFGKNPFATPDPSNGYKCPTNKQTDTVVCADDGKEYANRCVAEYEKQRRVIHEGNCTADEKLNSKSGLENIFKEASNSIPQALLQQILQIVSSMIVGLMGNAVS